ncbi:MAG: NAD+ synthase [Phycisphaerae bacterium]|jgi:NAD+ synthase (glutamine-hydrolysing)
MKIALAQINTIVGDLAGNAEKMLSFYKEAVSNGVAMVIFPELSICGYPPEDLIIKRHFLEDCAMAIKQLARQTGPVAMVAGFPCASGKRRYNSLAILADGKIKVRYDKMELPNYGVFDEIRYFDRGESLVCAQIGGVRVGLSICEDIWSPEHVERLKEHIIGTDFLINISASPFHKGKIGERKDIISACSRELGLPVFYCNMVGGQDELVFDGRSIITDKSGRIIAKAKYFEEDIIYADFERESGRIVACQEKALQPRSITEEVYEALVCGTRDYIRKNGFKKVVIGLSGGIDSALVATIAVKALGPDSVVGVTMPSKYNTTETISDAEQLAANLGIEFHTIPIGGPLAAMHEALGAIPGWDDTKTAYENLQARIRGTILMSMSNQFGYIVLTTGNKSETAVGYSTLYGDTAGGFAVIKDVPKTLVYELCRFINDSFGELIPETTITRAPSAELRDGQLDSDSLPDYDSLDAIIRGYVEQDKSADELLAEGLEADEINRVLRLIDLNEYKRRQSPPGLKITPKAFGRDRRLPITNKYRSQVKTP